MPVVNFTAAPYKLLLNRMEKQQVFKRNEAILSLLNQKV